MPFHNSSDVKDAVSDESKLVNAVQFLTEREVMILSDCSFPCAKSRALRSGPQDRLGPQTWTGLDQFKTGPVVLVFPIYSEKDQSKLWFLDLL
jgi:hypothetical protein